MPFNVRTFDRWHKRTLDLWYKRDKDVVGSQHWVDAGATVMAQLEDERAGVYLCGDGHSVALWDGVDEGICYVWNEEESPLVRSYGHWAWHRLKAWDVTRTENSCDVPMMSRCSECDGPIHYHLDYICGECRQENAAR